MSEFLLQLLNGLTLGGIYALIALGYTMVYGIVKLINFAHGEIFMVGAFTGLLVAGTLTQNFFAAIIIAMAFCALLGLIVEKTAYQPLRDSSAKNKIFTAVTMSIVILIAYLSKNSFASLFTNVQFYVGIALLGALVFWIIKRGNRSASTGSSRINALISAIGMSMIISNLVALIYGPQRANYPNLIDLGEVKFGGTSVAGLQFFIIIASLVLMFILHYIVHKTKIGLSMRAVSQNLDAARLMGINPNRVIGYTFAIGSALAAAAGVLVGVYYTVAEATMGSMYGLKAFVAAVLGGIGSIPGAMVGGFIFGILEIFGTAMTPYIVKFSEMIGVEFFTPNFKDAIAFGILIFILIIKPTGIFGKTTREKV